MNRSLTRRACLKHLGLGAAAAAWGPSLAQAQDPPRPNIIYIMTDDHAAHALSCYGSVVNRTPNLDRLAREGVRFTHSFCTNSLCAPCRAVVLTGKFNHVNGLTDNRQTFDGSQTTFPKLLQKAGYETAMIGKWHLKTDPTGFDYWNILPGQGLYYNPVFIEMGERKTYTGYCTDITTDLALNWLERRDANKPFLLMYHHKAPHRPWDPPLKNLHHYEDAPLAEPATLFDENQGRGKAAQEQDMTIAKTLTKRDLKIQGPDNLTPEQQQAWDAAYGPKNEAFQKANLQGDDLIRWKYQRYMKDYLRCIDSVDENVGRLLAYLDANGLAENTIVVYTSDQGFFLGDHGWFDKRFMYEESLRMPLLVRYPQRAKAGTTVSQLVQNLDFAQTFLDYAGVDAPGEMQGRSLRPLLEDKSPLDWRDAVYYHYYEYPAEHSVKRHYGIRTERYKLIHFYYDIDEWELYDLQADPEEKHNLYHDPALQDLVARLTRRLRALQAQYGDSDELAQQYLDEYLEGIKPKK